MAHLGKYMDIMSCMHTYTYTKRRGKNYKMGVGVRHLAQDGESCTNTNAILKRLHAEQSFCANALGVRGEEGGCVVGERARSAV